MNGKIIGFHGEDILYEQQINSSAVDVVSVSGPCYVALIVRLTNQPTFCLSQIWGFLRPTCSVRK